MRKLLIIRFQKYFLKVITEKHELKEVKIYQKINAQFYHY